MSESPLYRAGQEIRVGSHGIEMATVVATQPIFGGETFSFPVRFDDQTLLTCAADEPDDREWWIDLGGES